MAQSRMNDTYRRMQAQLDLALNALKRHNIAIPSDIKVETVRELDLDEDDKPEDTSKFPDVSAVPAENSVIE